MKKTVTFEELANASTAINKLFSSLDKIPWKDVKNISPHITNINQAIGTYTNMYNSIIAKYNTIAMGKKSEENPTGILTPEEVSNRLKEIEEMLKESIEITLEPISIDSLEKMYGKEEEENADKEKDKNRLNINDIGYLFSIGLVE